MLIGLKRTKLDYCISVLYLLKLMLEKPNYLFFSIKIITF